MEDMMIILWIRKNKANQQINEGKKEFGSFQEHDDVMKRFRLAHPDISQTCSHDMMTEEGNLLAPVFQVKLAENIQN
jgi:hypothetical protein